jgi:hypothetical protein
MHFRITHQDLGAQLTLAPQLISPSARVALSKGMLAVRLNRILLTQAIRSAHQINQDRSTTIRNTRNDNTFCRVDAGRPSPCKHSSMRATGEISTRPDCVHLNKTRLQMKHSDTTLPPIEIKKGSELTLADITDFDIRSSVAKLMAIAPTLPIKDLFHLLLDTKGDFRLAHERTIRANQTPQRHRHVTGQMKQRSLASSQDPYGDEIMVKIDPNDPAYEWDSDAPEPEPIAMPRSKHRSNKPPPKPSASRTEAHKPPKPTKAVFNAHASLVPMESCLGNGGKKTMEACKFSSISRETSSDREYLVSDDNASLASDDSYEDASSEDDRTSSSRSDIVLEGSEEEEEDVKIDIEPYNSRALGKKQRGQR